MSADNIRPATMSDIPAMMALAGERRQIYEQYQPTFWRRASDGALKQTAYFKYLLEQPNVITLICERDRIFHGFLIATLVAPPPVYAPGGDTCLIDDFAVSNDTEWITAGRALLGEAAKIAKARGAVQTVVVCGHLDRSKRKFLKSESLSIASEWYVNDL